MRTVGCFRIVDMWTGINMMFLNLLPDIYAVVTYNRQLSSYRLNVFSEDSVPLFGPPLPCPPIFTDHQEFRDFLLVKCKSIRVFHASFVLSESCISNRCLLLTSYLS